MKANDDTTIDNNHREVFGNTLNLLGSHDTNMVENLHGLAGNARRGTNQTAVDAKYRARYGSDRRGREVQGTVRIRPPRVRSSGHGTDQTAVDAKFIARYGSDRRGCEAKGTVRIRPQVTDSGYSHRYSYRFTLPDTVIHPPKLPIRGIPIGIPIDFPLNSPPR